MDPSVVTKNPVQFNDAIEKSLELSKAINDLGALTIIGGIFIVLVVIMFGFFIYQLVIYQKQLATINEASNKVLDYFENKKSKEITYDQARALIANVFSKIKLSVLRKIAKAYIERKFHNIAADVHSDVEVLILSTHQESQVLLSKFSYHDNNLINLIKDDHDDELRDMLTKDISNENLDILTFEERYDQLFQIAESEFESRLSKL